MKRPQTSSITDGALLPDLAVRAPVPPRTACHSKRRSRFKAEPTFRRVPTPSKPAGGRHTRCPRRSHYSYQPPHICQTTESGGSDDLFPTLQKSNASTASRSTRYPDSDDQMGEFFSPESLNKEVAGIEAFIESDLPPTRLSDLGVPHVVHTLFHKMLCTKTDLYRSLKACSWESMADSLRRLLGDGWIGRDGLHALLQKVLPDSKISRADASALFCMVDADSSGNVGIDELCNGIALLLADARQALLQRSRSIITKRSSGNLSYVSRYEVQLLVEAMRDAYRDYFESDLARDLDADYAASVEKELADVLDHFSFTLRGRIQLETFQKYVREHPLLESLMLNAADLAPLENSQSLSPLPSRGASLSLDDQERPLFVWKKGATAGGTYDAFMVRDKEVQDRVEFPSLDQERMRSAIGASVEVYTTGRWVPGILVGHNIDGTWRVKTKLDGEILEHISTSDIQHTVRWSQGINKTRMLMAACSLFRERSNSRRRSKLGLLPLGKRTSQPASSLFPRVCGWVENLPDLHTWHTWFPSACYAIRVGERLRAKQIG